MGKNMVIFDADMSSSTHTDNIFKNIFWFLVTV